MERLASPGSLATLGLVLFLVSAVPAYSIFLTLGWGWRFWAYTADRVVSLTIFQKWRDPIAN